MNTVVVKFFGLHQTGGFKRVVMGYLAVPDDVLGICKYLNIFIMMVNCCLFFPL
jgi:hypothetical protein